MEFQYMFVIGSFERNEELCYVVTYQIMLYVYFFMLASTQRNKQNSSSSFKIKRRNKVHLKRDRNKKNLKIPRSQNIPENV